MAYDPRMSTVRQTPRPNARQKREEENNFMTLPDGEIAGCISDIGISFSVADLHKPNPQQIQRVFEWFAELLMNATRDAVSPAMRSAADDMCGQHSEVFSADTRDLMGFFVVLKRLLWECGVHDFTFQDLYKPTRERLVKILSFIINFIRFRESQTGVIDEHFNKSEKTKQRIETLYSENQEEEDHLRELEKNRRVTEAALESKSARNKELSRYLVGLRDEQPGLIEKLESTKNEQARLKALLEAKMTQRITTRQAVDKLRPYAEQSPAELEDSLQDLNTVLKNNRSQIENLDRRARALQSSCDAFSTVSTDVQNCTSLLNELSREMQAEENAATAAAKGRDALSERTNNVRDIERQEKMLQKQLENVQRRTDKLRKNDDERREAGDKKMEELKNINEEIKKERGERAREMERRRVRIEQTEKKMADLKENIEHEVHSAHDEFVKMDSHIRLYIREMEQSIT